MDEDRANAPVLDAYDLGNGACAVWCNHCCNWHCHGTRDTLRHVAAHCAWIPPEMAPPDFPGNSPYLETGYWLKPAGPATPEVLRYITGQRLPGPVRH